MENRAKLYAAAGAECGLAAEKFEGNQVENNMNTVRGSEEGQIS